MPTASQRCTKFSVLIRYETNANLVSFPDHVGGNKINVIILISVRRKVSACEHYKKFMTTNKHQII